MIRLILATALLTAATATAPQLSPDQYPSEWKNKGQGRTFVLYRKYDVTAMSQGQAGSCVGTATAKALELMHGRQFSPEWCYAISRDLFNENGPKPGSYCAYAAQAMRDVGAVPASNYAILGYDLRKYDAAVARNWQPRGPPVAFRVIAANYRSPGYVKITTWEQLRDAISQEIPVIVGSSVGFGSRSVQVRSSTGMLRARWWSRWSHAMVFCGVSDGKSKRALLLNSWGTDWVTGPKWLGDEPDGSFWISKRDCEKMLEQGDAYAILPIPGI